MTVSLSEALLGVGVAAGIVNLVGIWSSISGVTSYYPLGEKNRWFHVFWGLTHTLNGTLLGVGVLQFGTLELPSWLFAFGAAATIVGTVVVLISTFDLGMEQTQGLEGELQTNGLYRYSRNPQYVGYILTTVGYGLIVGSPFAIPLCGLYLAWWFSFPLAEEPWLRERYGADYERYLKRVPRFVGVRTVQTLLNQWDGRWAN
ncbi:hypothetical protein C440_02393 [Haloferax mucosum ATCC BAA-1512]|uniref:Steroid 5-alpha reductase C-terminal domain-containing protein n=1 Tax=Haloferax mucosum ATCC BAA-1512 TaxID=662479 RepID=M0IMX3_9EURY|nr:isoprenylcysteine carboxylmethyltransferase family protein [Haloferax mucosum]ELZ98060.1 hypothetical protein C440_02393 [Haloferax mucosum ATCC BAA-1512]